MKNIITASVEFYFKGEKFTPSVSIDLDEYMQAGACVPDLYPLIAAANNIDLYSYEYEMMQAEPVEIRRSEGLVADYVTDGALDIGAFETAWRERKTVTTIRHIIAQHGLTQVLKQHPAIEQALLDVYKAGQENHQPAGTD